MSAWKHLPHGEIEEILPGLWQVTGSLPRGGLPRNMVLWRLPGGGLWVHSAVSLEPAAMRYLEALGRPEVMVVPNGFHRLDAPAWKARYPELQVVAPAASRKKVEEVVPVDATVEEALPAHGIVVHQPDGLKPAECWYELPIEGGRHALVCTDTLFNMPQHLSGFEGFVFRYVTASTGHFGTTRLSRLALVKDASALAGWLQAQADRPGLAAVLVAHGDAVVDDVAGRLRAAR